MPLKGFKTHLNVRIARIRLSEFSPTHYPKTKMFNSRFNRKKSEEVFSRSVKWSQLYKKQKNYDFSKSSRRNSIAGFPRNHNVRKPRRSLLTSLTSTFPKTAGEKGLIQHPLPNECQKRPSDQPAIRVKYTSPFVVLLTPLMAGRGDGAPVDVEKKGRTGRRLAD